MRRAGSAKVYRPTAPLVALSEKVAGYGYEEFSVQAIITGGVPDEVARTLLLKIAGRMKEKRGRYALAALPKVAKVSA
jgi:hypothetical protein